MKEKIISRANESSRAFSENALSDVTLTAKKKIEDIANETSFGKLFEQIVISEFLPSEEKWIKYHKYFTSEGKDENNIQQMISELERDFRLSYSPNHTKEMASEFKLLLSNFTKKVFENLNQEFGTGNYQLVTCERGMRDFYLMAKKVGIQQKISRLFANRSLFIRLLNDTDNLYRWVIAKQYLAQSGLDAETIIKEKRNTVLLDEANYGNVIIEAIEVLTQSMKEVQTNEQYAEKVQEYCQKNPQISKIIIFGRGYFDLIKIIQEKLPYKQVVHFNTNYRLNFLDNEELSELLNSHFFKDRITINDFISNNVLFVCADTDPEQLEIKGLKKLMEPNTGIPDKTKINNIIIRDLSPKQINLRQYLHPRLIYSCNGNVPQVVNDDKELIDILPHDAKKRYIYNNKLLKSNLLEDIAKKLENSIKTYEPVEEIKDEDGSINPIVNYYSPAKIAISLIYLKELLG